MTGPRQKVAPRATWPLDLVLVLLLLGCWQWIVTADHIDAIIVPGPIAVARDIWERLGLYMRMLGLTIATVGTGTALGLALGGLSAMAGWRSATFSGLAAPVVAAVSAVPLVAILPLLTRFLGYGVCTNLAISAITVFFPTYVLGTRALTKLPPGSWEMFQALGATRSQALWRLAVPAAAADFMVAVKINASLGVMGGIGAEYITGVGGLGALYSNERANFSNPEIAWSVAVFSILLTFAIYFSSSWLHRRVVEWSR